MPKIVFLNEDGAVTAVKVNGASAMAGFIRANELTAYIAFGDDDKQTELIMQKLSNSKPQTDEKKKQLPQG